VPADSPDPRSEPSGGPGSDAPRGHPARPLRRLHRSEPRSERYYFLLALLLIDVCVIGLVGDSKWATFTYTPLTAATLLLALRTSEAKRGTMRIAWVAATIAVVASAAVAITGSTHLVGYVYFMLFALLLISPAAIGRRIIMSRSVTPRLLVAAICVYLMLGLLFTFIYLGVNGVHPNFFAQGVQKDPSVYLYFSFITMTTVGFGDFTPGYAVPRVLVVFEAMLGQVYLVVAVARLVSLLGTAELGSAIRSPEDDV
jgi:hypothetical protein